MPKIYWMEAYNIREGKHTAYKAFLDSSTHKKLCEQVEAETGMKYIETYLTIIPSSHEQGDYDAYEFWELPNHAAMDRIRNSTAIAKMGEASYELIEPKPSKSVVLRKAADAKTIYEPKKK